MSDSSISAILETFKGLDLEELDAVKLQNRVDSKFVFREEVLPEALREVAKHYNVLVLGNIRSNEYHSLYYETPENHFFISHHNGKMNRYKVRYRQYMDSGLCYLEVKFKNNKGRTVKGRMKVQSIAEQLNEEEKK